MLICFMSTSLTICCDSEPLVREVYSTADTHSLRDVAARTVDAAIDLALGRFRTAVVRR
jgi:hypothetical protein